MIYTERTNGRFVSKDVVIIGSIKDEQAIGCTKKYLREMHALDYHREEIHRLIDDLEAVQTKEENEMQFWSVMIYRKIMGRSGAENVNLDD